MKGKGKDKDKGNAVGLCPTPWPVATGGAFFWRLVMFGRAAVPRYRVLLSRRVVINCYDAKKGTGEYRST